MGGWGRIYDNMMFGLRTHSNALNYIQEQISSGTRVIRPSDDPTSAFQVMRLRREQHSLETCTRNLNHVTLNLETASQSLAAMSADLVQLKGSMTQMLSETYSGKDRFTAAAGIDVLLDSMVALANKESLGQYVFGGDGTRPPYEVEKVDGRVVAVNYVGGTQARLVPVGPGMQQPATLVGESIFRCDQRSEPQLTGNTGALGGTGTSSVRGDLWLTIQHVATTYGGTSGVAAGPGSAAGDTILGTSHKLTVDVDAGTVALDDGPAVSFGVGGDDANIRLTNASLDVAHVDLTGLDGGLSGIVEVPITATGRMSIDGGVSFSPLVGFGANEAVTDEATGRVLYVDATQVQRSGGEAVHVGGTYNVFEMLISIRDALLNEEGLSSSQQTALLNQANGTLDAVSDELARSSTSLGARLSVMDDLSETLEGRAADVEARTSLLQDADIIELATELTRTQTYYEMILTTTAKVLNMSLLDYM